MQYKRPLDSHERITIAIILAIISFFILSASFSLPIAFIGAWDVLALTDIILSWRVILKKDARITVQNARLQDSSRSVILFFVILTSVISLVAIAFLIKSAKHSALYNANSILFFAFITLAISWVLVHTVFTIHYAHLYYSETDGGHKGGLDFPNEKNPVFTDFAYYSFVVGMTFQVSDTQVTSRSMRKLTLAHSIIAFVFNTFILALAINIIAGLL